MLIQVVHSHPLQDSYNLADSEGPSDFDTRHRFSLNGTYELPFHGNRLTDGWQVVVVEQAQTGNPLNIITNLSTISGSTSVRPDLIGATGSTGASRAGGSRDAGRMTDRRREFLILWAAGMVGVALLLPYSLSLTALPPNVSFGVLVAAALVQNGILLAVAVGAGLWCAGRVRLGAPILEAALRGEAVLDRLRRAGQVVEEAHAADHQSPVGEV